MTEYAQEIQHYAALAGDCLERQIILAALNEAWQARHQLEVTNLLAAGLIKRQLWPVRDVKQAIAALKQRQAVYDDMIANAQLQLVDIPTPSAIQDHRV